jgi:PAS domain S-box-containing protein
MTELDKISLDQSPDAAIATSENGAVLFWSKGAETLFGFTRDEAAGRIFSEMVSAGTPLEPIPSDGNIVTYETMQRRKDGSLVDVCISVKAVRDERKQVQFTLFSVRDMTNLKVNRDAKMLEARFGHLLESMPDGIVMINAAGRMVLANSQAERIFRYGAGELLCRPIEELIPPRFRGGHVGHRTNYFGQPRSRPMGAGLELFGLRKDGSEFPVEISLSPLQTADGTLVSSAIRDITDRKHVQRELEEKNAALEAANQELESFSYSISHDLRAPLRAMGGFTRILEKQFGGPIPPEARQAMNRIRDNASQMGRLIDGLLDFSSLGRRAVTRRKMDPVPLVRAIADELLAENSDRTIEFEIEALPALEADPNLLRQVFVNLLSNAVKYSRGKKPAIIKIGAQTEKGQVAYYVCDNGAGFDMEYSGKLFKVFQRLHRADEFEGTGVGLAIVQRIVERHGGRVWAESKVGEGATFFFTLGTAA